MPTVDLPAAFVSVDTSQGPGTLVGGSAALATPDTSGYAVLTWGPFDSMLGYRPVGRIYVGDSSGSGSATDTFGTSDIPYGSVQKIEIAAIAYRDGGGTIPSPPDWEANGEEPPGDDYPVLSWDYNGLYDGVTGWSAGHTLPLPTAWQEVTRELLPHEWQYILTTHPDYGTTTPDDYQGLAPRFLPGPQSWAGTGFPAVDIYVAYLALRITYAATHAPPLRQYPRSDGLATSSARRMWPPSRSYQRGIRRAGGYL